MTLNFCCHINIIVLEQYILYCAMWMVLYIRHGKSVVSLNSFFATLGHYYPMKTSQSIYKLVFGLCKILTLCCNLQNCCSYFLSISILNEPNTEKLVHVLLRKLLHRCFVVSTVVFFTEIPVHYFEQLSKSKIWIWKQKKFLGIFVDCLFWLSPSILQHIIERITQESMTFPTPKLNENKSYKAG